MRVFVLFFLLAPLCAQLTGCGHDPARKKIEQPSYYHDNDLAFDPKRLWRLWVRWEPHPLDQGKAFVIKEFQLVVREPVERSRLERTMADYGGDQGYLRWFEASVFPLSDRDARDQARVFRRRDETVVVLTTRAVDAVAAQGFLRVDRVDFPDPLLAAFWRPCRVVDWDVLSKGDSVGIEVVLESRSEKPSGDAWQTLQGDSPSLFWRSWSVGQGRRLSYRTIVAVKSDVARCPLPSTVSADLKRPLSLRPMGVEW